MGRPNPELKWSGLNGLGVQVDRGCTDPVGYLSPALVAGAYVLRVQGSFKFTSGLKV